MNNCGRADLTIDPYKPPPLGGGVPQGRRGHGGRLWHGVEQQRIGKLHLISLGSRASFPYKGKPCRARTFIFSSTLLLTRSSPLRLLLLTYNTAPVGQNCRRGRAFTAAVLLSPNEEALYPARGCPKTHLGALQREEETRPSCQWKDSPKGHSPKGQPHLRPRRTR